MSVFKIASVPAFGFTVDWRILTLSITVTTSLFVLVGGWPNTIILLICPFFLRLEIFFGCVVGRIVGFEFQVAP